MLLNEDGLIDGDLAEYFRVVFNNASNVNLPYHNFRHMMHVAWLCHDACEFYGDELTKRERRSLLIAAMFHDFDHRGIGADDHKNIELAVKGLEKHILPEDRPYLQEISNLIKVTEYPYNGTSPNLILCAQILRDADLTQSLNIAWIQQVIFGLAAERKLTPIAILEDQISFLKNVKIKTKWGQNRWPQVSINKKLEECERLLGILNGK